MIATMEIVDILDDSEHIGQMILKSEVMENYNIAKEELEQDKKAQQLIGAFRNKKEHYEDVQRFGRYHPDYSTIMKEIRSTKREMDMNEKVAAYKIAERNLQKLLDEVSENVAQSVSTQVKAPKDGAALHEGGCGHGTGSSGCGCAS